MTQRQQIILTTGILIALLALYVVVLLVNARTDTAGLANAAALYAGLTRRMSNDGAPILGALEAPVTIVVFLDYACPHCGLYQSTLSSFIEQSVRTGQARLEIRLLAGLDPAGSPLAARAALCAGAQNAFWEMHDELIRMQASGSREPFTTERIRASAEKLGLNTEELLRCVANADSYRDALQSNVDLANSLGIRTLPAVLYRRSGGYPAWFEQDGQRLTGGLPLNVLQSVLQVASGS